MFDTVNNFSVTVTENDIAVFSHQLYDQGFLAEIAHFIQMFNIKVNDTLHMRLVNLYDPAIGNMLAQYHAEVWRSHRAWFILTGQI